MKTLAFLMAMVLAVSTLAIAGCNQAAPAATPTTVLTSKAAEPTTAQGVQPTAQTQLTATTEKKMDYPQKGKAITVIAPFAAGGNTDVGARLVAAGLEKELGTPVQVVNKVGAGSQVGLTDISLAKPDGYTLGVAPLPSAIGVYMDPDRKAIFDRKSFQPIAQTLLDPIAIAVKSDSPYKSMKDLAEAAKARPGQLKVACGGILSVLHLTLLQVEKVSGGKFADVHFESGAQGVTALLGDHVDVSVNVSAELQSQAKSGSIRVLGIADKQESKFFPKVPTLESQGYGVVMATINGLAAPTGLPNEMVQLLSVATKKSLDAPELTTKMADMGMESRYLDATQFGAQWDVLDSQVKPLIDESKQK